ncbi:MAG: tRNA 2-thiouridine(34) synthase MnmA [Candidatus Magasanikbacteria bacterium CG_4_10_14_0_2_um_filter_37_12]|uniref:tRNA-specific 2-thiouridylase MnmA n=1 Tax=Candidatus Magasanikbacteria bacterium CG_4_10_14_0_2_um_filter_37_12 TaxID=1974637 RepID=A0A2M7V926_9BACT|nr:MAG: tRNA 2-thiouridine(34) synthase MnmA [Candidatus Magasanikbacteria bacterium CG_4_10_14_0_2_um_filter_37_12]
MLEKKEKILVAMSGGVDSSVVAALLVEVGYDVTGAFIINYDANKEGFGSCYTADYRDALRVAAKLSIPLLKLDFAKEYKELVLDYMYQEYEKGRTPNPDVMCNKFVKFGVWLDKVREMGFDYIATGHYAKVESRKSKVESYELKIAKDTNKDQTYFLHQLNQAQLSYTLFPLGEYTKIEVRELAKKFDLPTANKDESMGICFVGEVDMKEFLQNKIRPTPGNIVTFDGVVLGQHDGLAFYTIGQRHVGVGSQKSIKSKVDNDSKPLYVVDKRFDANELVVGHEDDPLLWKKEIMVGDVNWISGHPPIFPLQCEVRLRHRQELQKSKVTKSLKSKVFVEFEKNQRAVTPGQFAVFYKDGVCFGGGVIE